MLGSGGSLVADAANPTIAPRDQWRYMAGYNGKDADGGDIVKSQDGCVMMAIPFSASPGSEVDISFSVGPYPGTLNSSRYITVYLGFLEGNTFNCADNILIDHNTTFTHGGDYQVKKQELKIPESYVQPCIVIITNYSGDLYLWNFGIYDVSTDKGILNSIKEGFSKLWEWLQGIWDSIKEIPTKIGQFITALGDRIKTFFTDLVNNMRNFFTSLGDRISGFFNDIWEKIKAFFLPHDGYFDEYSAKFNAFIDEHFGFLAQLPDELSLIINTLVNYTPADPPYIDFPTVKVPIPGHEFTLIQGQKYVFTILTQSPYNMLYSAYQGFVWLAYCLMLFNFLKHKYNVIFGGDGSAD